LSSSPVIRTLFRSRPELARDLHWYRAGSRSEKEAAMRGVITSRDVLLNLRTIWVEFGLATLVCCLAAMLRSRPTTFLDVVMKRHAAA
jgi:hypothetical protein